MTAQEFCNSAMGKPWVNRAEGPNSYDCFGLVLDSFRQIEHVELPQINGYTDKQCDTESAANEAIETGLFPMCRPKEGAIVAVCNSKGQITHVGRVLCGRILHTTRRLGVRHESIKAFVRNYNNVRFHEFTGS